MGCQLLEIQSRVPCGRADRNIECEGDGYELAGVASHAGARIETCSALHRLILYRVASHAGARIETYATYEEYVQAKVASHAGARIETKLAAMKWLTIFVASHAGARIETRCWRLG